MKIQLFAHRGGMGRAPENTLASFKQALADGADAFEIDVCLTKDQEPVLIHVDYNRHDIRKATGCPTHLNSMKWKEVENLKVQNSNEPVAHLDDALRFAHENQMQCFIEPKSDTPELLPIIIERIHHFDVIHIVNILTFYLRKHILIDVKRLEPRLQTSAIFLNPFANFLKAATMTDIKRVIFGWDKINHFKLYNTFTHAIPRQVDELRSNGFAVDAGFILRRKDVAWAMQNGIEGLWVDDVPFIRESLEEIRNNSELWKNRNEG